MQWNAKLTKCKYLHFAEQSFSRLVTYTSIGTASVVRSTLSQVLPSCVVSRGIRTGQKPIRFIYKLPYTHTNIFTWCMSKFDLDDIQLYSASQAI